MKIKWSFDVEEPKAIYEVPFGVIERPCDGEEEPGLTWFGVKGTNGGFAICNSDTYSGSVKDSTIYHTVLRSPIYGDHGGPRSEKSDYTEQGVREFTYSVVPFTKNSDVIKVARLINKPVTNIIENWHEGKLNKKVYSSVNVSEENVIISAIKRSEDGKGLVVRIYETDGKDTDVIISGDLLTSALNIHITPYSVDTYYLEDGKCEWKNVLMTEYDFE